jgi:hypothetical protein
LRTEPSTSAIRAAEVVQGETGSRAAHHLQLARRNWRAPRTSFARDKKEEGGVDAASRRSG